MSLVLCAAFVTATASVSEPARIEALVEGRGPLPSLAHVQAAAVEALALASEDYVREWPARARRRGLLPRVDLAAGSDSDLDVSASRRSEGSWTRKAGRAFGLELHTRFELGELVFSDAELRASREALARSAAVALARERVTKLYFDRLELCLLERMGATPEFYLAAARLDGLIFALTGGRIEMGRGENAP